MPELLRLLVGSIVPVLCMAGVMLKVSKSPQLAGLQLFPFLNHIGRYVWLVDFQQVLMISAHLTLWIVNRYY